MKPEVVALQMPVTDEAPRCWRCRRKLAERATRPWEIVCDRCKATNSSAPVLTEDAIRS